MSTILNATDLKVHHGPVRALAGVNLSLERGEILAVVGESGSGKSTLTRALLGLTPPTATVSGSVVLDDVEVTSRSARALRGETISLVPQDPGASLDPVRTIGAQLFETLKLHRSAELKGAAEAETSPSGIAAEKPQASLRERAIQLLDSVGIDRPAARLKQYPHELSGGLKQRVLIALAFSREPTVLVADEPTSALDVTVQKLVLSTFTALARSHGTSVVFVTHDIAVATDLADRVVVLKAGQIVETGSVKQLATDAQAEYTRALLGQALPSSTDADAKRTTEPEDAALEVHDLVKSFGDRTVVDSVNLTVPRGTTFALVGESGSGKSTTARMILGLETPDSGSVKVLGQETVGLGGAARRELWSKLQLVHQNPDTSLDPRWSVAKIIAEPLRHHSKLARAERELRVREALEHVHLPQSLFTSRPGELSGGQRQRVAIARTLAVGAQVLVLDEALSALDVVTQERVLDLLDELQADLGLTYLFISHDLAVVERFSHHVGVLSGGRLVETGPTANVFAAPTADATRMLLDARPGERLRTLVAAS
ncbi:MAG: ABC transporter ATP-binding protein [Galactobacter sp.]